MAPASIPLTTVWTNRANVRKETIAPNAAILSLMTQEETKISMVLAIDGVCRTGPAKQRDDEGKEHSHKPSDQSNVPASNH